MNNNVIKIIGIIIKKMLNNEKVWENYEEIVDDLEEQGYSYENINEAFDFLYSEEITVNDSGFYIDYEMPSGYNRSFTKVENFYFSKEIKAVIYKLNSLEILKAEELELIIFRMMQIAAYNDLKIDSVWEIINEVVDDQELLFNISSQIKEFDGKYLKEHRVN